MVMLLLAASLAHEISIWRCLSARMKMLHLTFKSQILQIGMQKQHPQEESPAHLESRRASFTQAHNIEVTDVVGWKQLYAASLWY